MDIVFTIIIAAIGLVNGFILWILNHIAKQMRDNKVDFTEKIDRVVGLYQTQRVIDNNKIEGNCKDLHDLSLKVKEMETIYKIAPYLKDK
jgi:hypothetical protein